MPYTTSHTSKFGIEYLLGPPANPLARLDLSKTDGVQVLRKFINSIFSELLHPIFIFIFIFLGLVGCSSE